MFKYPAIKLFGLSRRVNNSINKTTFNRHNFKLPNDLQQIYARGLKLAIRAEIKRYASKYKKIDNVSSEIYVIVHQIMGLSISNIKQLDIFGDGIWSDNFHEN